MVENGITYHIGIETGGTTCKVGIFSGKNGDLNKLDFVEKEIFETKMPEDTIKQMCDFINQTGRKYSSMGVAAFGPICLDKTSDKYGFVTSTPKVDW